MTCLLLSEALEDTGEFVVTSAMHSSEAIEAATQQAYDVAAITADMDGNPLGGLTLLRRLRHVRPELRAVMLLDSSTELGVLESFKAGARGVFCRTDSFPLLRKCLHRIHEGQIWANAKQFEYVVGALNHSPVSLSPTTAGSGVLSKREEQVAYLVAQGYTNREISERLGLSEHTIKNYLFRTFEKLDISTRVELVLYAVSHVRGLDNLKEPPSLLSPAEEPGLEEQEAAKEERYLAAAAAAMKNTSR